MSKQIAEMLTAKITELHRLVLEHEPVVRHASGAGCDQLKMTLFAAASELDRYQPFSKQKTVDDRLEELADLTAEVVRPMGGLHIAFDSFAELLGNAIADPTGATMWADVGAVRGHFTAFADLLAAKLAKRGIVFQVPLPTDRGERFIVLVDVGAWEGAPHKALYEHLERDAPPAHCYLCQQPLDSHDGTQVRRIDDPRRSHTGRSLHTCCSETFIELCNLVAGYANPDHAARADAEAGRSGELPALPQVAPPELVAEENVPLREPTIEAKSDLEMELDEPPAKGKGRAKK